MLPIAENVESDELKDMIEEQDATLGGKWEIMLQSQFQQATQGMIPSVWVKMSSDLRRDLADSGHASSPHTDYGVSVTTDLEPFFEDYGYFDYEDMDDDVDVDEEDDDALEIIFEVSDDESNPASEFDHPEKEEHHAPVSSFLNRPQHRLDDDDIIPRCYVESSKREDSDRVNDTTDCDSWSSSDDGSDEAVSTALQDESGDTEHISRLCQDFDVAWSISPLARSTA